MSESFFGLRKRPFAALPDVDCFVPLNGICQAFDELMQTTTEGRGIGVLTAPAGIGKTLVCQRLARELSGNFRVVFLPSGNFLTRRSLLQAILFELGHSFVRMGDQELRLALSTTLQAIRPVRRGLVLIVDEAHLLAARMLEELRGLLNQGQAGEPLVRLIVSGQLSLEETLSRPQCDAFNQRIGCQSMLPSLTRDESSSYLTRRLAWAGANVSEVFTREALVTICEAADGVPRCLHQLADHCLTLAGNRSEKPINVRTVHEALEHLKQLPLTWAEPTTGRRVTNPLEAARAEAGLPSPIAIEIDGPMARPSTGLGVSGSSNREPLEVAYCDTYPLQVDPPEVAAEPEGLRNSWELDSHSVLVSPWNDEDVTPRSDRPVAAREPYTGVDDDELQLIDATQPTSTTMGANIEYGDTIEGAAIETGNAIEVIAACNAIEVSAAGNAIEIAPIAPVLNECRETLGPRHIGSGNQDLARQMIEADVLPVLPELEASQLDSTQPVEVTTSVDEEVVIDRYAALDSALSRLTRTMLNVRDSARRKAAEVVAPPEPAPIAVETMAVESIDVESIDAVHQRFDIVLPEEDGVEESTDAFEPSAIEPAREPARAAALAMAAAVANSTAPPAASGRESTNSSAPNERRPYQLLFSELRRRRKRV